MSTNVNQKDGGVKVPYKQSDVRGVVVLSFCTDSYSCLLWILYLQASSV